VRAIILAGGKGTRLRPYTTLIPKPLVPIGGDCSILEIIIRQLANAGFTHITLAVNHFAKLIIAYFGDGSEWNVKLDFSLEDKPLSTIGPLTLVDDLPDNFLVMNGDILCNLDYRKFFDEHVKRENQVSVSVFKRVAKIDFGVLKFDDNNFLTEFREKPTYNFDVSMGIYCINRTVIEKLEKGVKYGFDNLMLDGIKNGDRIWINQFDGLWLDIGRPEDYQYADENYLEIKKTLGFNG
jgi:NDP-mannose synthase